MLLIIQDSRFKNKRRALEKALSVERRALEKALSVERKA
jgi:uncharacterized membrane protein YccC